MTQETRKERRVKIVSLNVRYRSATLEEFIENHAHDVSRGGIFIKAANPFPPGTLLKFEIRLANDQAVISGVGRVVWKRDGGVTVGGDTPSGMGVKFIKLDEPSKAVIDRLVSTKADAGTAYETEAGEVANPPGVPPAVPSSQNLRGRPPPPPPHGRAIAVPARKPTMIGVGASAMGVGPAARSSVPPRPSTPARPPSGAMQERVSERPAAPMFPQSDFSEESAAGAEPTLMKQAAELLEEALREAGGSLAEVGSNPLFAARGASSAESEERGSQAKTKVAAIAAADVGLAVAPSTVAVSKPERAAAPKAPPREIPKVDPGNVPKALVATTRGSAHPVVERPPPRRGKPVGVIAAVSVVLVLAGVGVAVTRRHHQPAAAVQPPVPRPPALAAAPPTRPTESTPSSLPVALAVPPASPLPPTASAALSAPRSDAGATPRAAAPVTPRQRPKPPAGESAASSAAPVSAAAPSAEAVSAAVPSATAPSPAAPSAAAPSATASPPASPSATATPESESKAATSAPKAKPPATPKKPAKGADDNPY